MMKKNRKEKHRPRSEGRGLYGAKIMMEYAKSQNRREVAWTDINGVGHTGVPTGLTYRGRVEVKDARGKTYFVSREKLEEAKGFEGLRHPESSFIINSEGKSNGNAEQGTEGKSGSGVAEKLSASGVP